MSVLKKPRSYELYLKKIQKKAVNTQNNFKNSWLHFDRFCMVEYLKPSNDLIEEMKLSDIEAVLDILQEWVNWADLSPSTLPVYFTNIRSYLYYRGVKISNLDVKQNIVFPKIHLEELHPLSNEEFNKILEAASYRNKAFYLCLSSCGLRPVELCNIRLCDLELDKKRIIVHVPAKYTKLKRARTTFFSLEAAKKLKPLIKNLGDNDLIFGGFTNARDNVFNKLLKRAGLHKQNDKGYSTINLMSFRSWFITKVSRHDYNLAKKWAGQKGYMLQYDRTSIEEQLEKYIEIEPDLIVSNDERNKMLISRQQKKLDEADSLRKSVKELQGGLDEMALKFNEVIKSYYETGKISYLDNSQYRK